MKRLLPAFVCGFGASVITTIPGLKSFGCCLIIPMAAYFSLMLDQKINRNMEIIRPSKATAFGLFTGLFAAVFSTVFEILLTYLLKSNDFVATLPELDGMLHTYMAASQALTETTGLLKSIEWEVTHYGFSTLYLFFFLLNSLIVNTVFGIAGGLFGMYFINKRAINQ